MKTRMEVTKVSEYVLYMSVGGSKTNLGLNRNGHSSHYQELCGDLTFSHEDHFLFILEKELEIV